MRHCERKYGKCIKTENIQIRVLTILSFIPFTVFSLTISHILYRNPFPNLKRFIFHWNQRKISIKNDFRNNHFEENTFFFDFFPLGLVIKFLTFYKKCTYTIIFT